MRWVQKLWNDEHGAVMSAELVLIGTLGVVGATVGLKAVSNSVNEELKDFSRAIRSLDQSYEFAGTSSCGAWTAGSCFRQKPVDEALLELDAAMERDEQEAVEAVRDADRQRQIAPPRMAPPREDSKPAPRKKPKSKSSGKADEEVVL